MEESVREKKLLHLKSEIQSVKTESHKNDKKKKDPVP